MVGEEAAVVIVRVECKYSACFTLSSFTPPPLSSDKQHNFDKSNAQLA
jgi:hypothetical protein